MNKDLLQVVSAELKDGMEVTPIEVLINGFTSPVDFGKNVIGLIRQMKSIPDRILWNNLYLFLQEGNFNDEILRKLAARLEESGDKQENAIRIIYTINRIDDPRKAKFISWLTLSVIDQRINFDHYFRLIKAIENLVFADLMYLSRNVENVRIEPDDFHIDEFLANGLIYSINGGFAYTDKAYDIIEYGVRRGQSIRRPKEKPERQIVEVATEDDINEVLNKTFS